MERVNRGLAAAYPDVDAGIKTTIVPMKDQIVGDVRPVLWVLMGAVLFVLLISCVNVANLQLARATARQREFAVRVALGAQQGRLIRQVLTESLALSLVGGALGLLLAYWGSKAAVAAIPDMLPRAENVGMDGRVLFFTLLVSVLAGVIFGLAPALRTSRTDVSSTLNQSGRSLVGKPRPRAGRLCHPRDGDGADSAGGRGTDDPHPGAAVERESRLPVPRRDRLQHCAFDVAVAPVTRRDSCGLSAVRSDLALGAGSRERLVRLGSRPHDERR